MRTLTLFGAAILLSGCDLLLTVSSAALVDSPVDDTPPSRPSGRDECLRNIPNDPGTAEAEREIIEYCEDRGL